MRRQYDQHGYGVAGAGLLILSRGPAQLLLPMGLCGPVVVCVVVVILVGMFQPLPLATATGELCPPLKLSLKV